MKKVIFDLQLVSTIPYIDCNFQQRKYIIKLNNKYYFPLYNTNSFRYELVNANTFVSMVPFGKDSKAIGIDTCLFLEELYKLYDDVECVEFESSFEFYSYLSNIYK